MFLFKFFITCVSHLALTRGKDFIKDLLELLPLPLETSVPCVWERIQKLWVVCWWQWWDDALWDSISQLAFTLLSGVIRDTVNIPQHPSAHLSSSQTRTSVSVVLASVSLYSTHLPQGISQVLEFSLITLGSAVLPRALAALPSILGAGQVLLQGSFGADWQEHSCSLSQRCLGAKWCIV